MGAVVTVLDLKSSKTSMTVFETHADAKYFLPESIVVNLLLGEKIIFNELVSCSIYFSYIQKWNCRRISFCVKSWLNFYDCRIMSFKMKYITHTFPMFRITLQCLAKHLHLLKLIVDLSDLEGFCECMCPYVYMFSSFYNCLFSPQLLTWLNFIFLIGLIF